MKFKLSAPLIALAIATGSVSAQAQDGDLTRKITVTYTGTVVDDVRDTIRIRQPDGTTVPYNGPVPEYPYKKGDEVKISFDTVVPTGAYYNRYVGQQSADGIYRFTVNGPQNSSSPTSFGYTPQFDVTGPIDQDTGNGERLSTNGLTVVYNANTDSYSIETGSTWRAGNFDAPTYLWNAVTNSLSLVPSACIQFAQCENAGLQWRGNGSSATLGHFNGGTVPIGNSSEPGNQGFFNFNLNGGWGISSGGSTGGSTGNPTQVPEPSVLVLFGVAAGATMFARRRRKAAA